MAEKIKILLTAVDKTKTAFRSVDNNMTKMKKSSKLMAAALGPIGTFAAAGALVMIGKQALDAADEIQKMSKRLSISTEALSQYQHVARLSGTDFESLAKAIGRSQRVIADSEDGLSTAVRALEDMGLSVEELKRLKPEDAFEKMGAAMAAIEDPYTRASVAANVFGRAGKDLLPIFADGADAIKLMREEADRMGLTLSQDMADAAAEANDAITKMSASVKVLARNIAIDLAPKLTEFQKKSDEYSADSMISELNKTDSVLADKLASMHRSFGGLNTAFVLAAIAASDSYDEIAAGGGTLDEMTTKFRAVAQSVRDARREFSQGFESDLQQGAFGEDMQAQARIQALPALTAETDAFNASLKDLTFGMTEFEGIVFDVDEALGFQSGLEDMRFNMQGIGEAAEAAAPAIAKIADEASEASLIMEQEGISAANAFGDAIVDSALRGEEALKSLGNIAKSIFGQIISSFIGIGVRSIFNPVGAVTGGGIGPGLDGTPMGGLTSGATTNINSLNVTATSSISNDPMSIRRVAEQIHDELQRVTETQGARG